MKAIEPTSDLHHAHAVPAPRVGGEPRWPPYVMVALAVLTVIAALLRFHAIADKSFWTDEGTSIELVRLDWYNFLRILWRREGNMSLYYLLLRAWEQFGHSEAYLRSLSILPALATLPALYALGRRLFNSRVGLMAVLLLTVNAYHVRYSQEARSYTLYVFLCVLSSLYFVEYLQEQSRRARVLHVLFSALAVYAHFFAALLIAAQWLSLRLLDRRDLQEQMRDSWRKIAVAILPALIFIATTGTGLLSWIARPGLTAVKAAALEITGNGGGWLVVAYGAACLATVLPDRRRWFQRVPWEMWRYRFLLIWLLFPIAVMFLISQLKPLFLPRYFILVLPALILLAASGLERVISGRRAQSSASQGLMAGALALFVLLSLRGDLAYYRKDFDIAREDWRGATHYILANSHPDDVIIFHQAMGRMPYEYYRSLDVEATVPTVVYPFHGARLTYRDFYAGRPPDDFLLRAARDYGRVWVVLSHNRTAAGVDPVTKALDSVFQQNYGGVQVTRFPEIELRKYDRK